MDNEIRKISKSCKVDAGMGPENIKRFLKRNKKGKITGFVELKIKKREGCKNSVWFLILQNTELVLNGGHGFFI